MKPSLLLSALLLSSPILAAAQSDIAEPVRQFVDAFNRGDSTAANKLYSSGSIAIADEFAPNLWQGPHALQAWSADYNKHAQRTGVTEGKVSYSAPTRTEVEGSSAYVIMPAVYLYKENGRPMKEEAQITTVLRKESGGWKIASWTWSGVKPHPGK